VAQAALGSSSLRSYVKIQDGSQEAIGSDFQIRESQRALQDDVDTDEPDAERRVMYATTIQVRSLIRDDLSD
jgi:hypothetical protein